MKEKIIEKRYAEAFLAYAKNSIGQGKGVEELKNLKIVICENPDLEKFLYNPEIGLADKFSVIDRVFAGAFSEEIRHLLKLLLEKFRIRHIQGICDYARMNYSNGGTIETVLRTSYPLDLELVEKIKRELETKIGKKTHLYLDLSPDLLGGVQIRIGNFLLDGSVRRRLDELKEKLRTIQVD